MSTRIEPAPGVSLFYLDDAGVLFSESRQELHALNAMAAVIWTLLEEGHDAQGVAAELQAMYAMAPAQARQFVADALDEWTRKGLVGAATAAGAIASSPADEPAAAVVRTWQDFEIAAERHYRLLNSRIRLRCSTRAADAIVHPILAHLEAPSCDGEVHIDIVACGETLAVYRDRVGFAECGGLERLAPIVKSLVWMTAVRDHSFFLDIHAGVVGDGTACILFPAAPGSGKSTLTAALVHAGLLYFSDEVALLSDGALEVYPCPLAICVKATGVQALVDRFPEVARLPVHKRGDGKDVVYLPPPRASLTATDAARPVAAIVFPQYREAAPTSLQRLSSPDALKRLLNECLVVTPPLDLAKVQALIGWVDRTPCYALSYGVTGEAVAAVRQLFAT